MMTKKQIGKIVERACMKNENGADLQDALEDELLKYNLLSDKVEEEKSIEEVVAMSKNVFLSPQRPDKRWFFKDLIYRDVVTLLDGPGGVGKSYLMLQLAISAVLHEPFLLSCFEFHFHEDKDKNNDIFSHVVYLISEDSDEIIDSRLHSITRDKFNIKDILDYLHIINTLNFNAHKKLCDEFINPTPFFYELSDFIRENNVELLIVDPLVSFFAGDENSNSDAANFHALLRQLNTTVVVTHHNSKYSNTARGASAWREQARSRLVLANNELRIEKMNYSVYNNYSIDLVFKENMFYATSQEPAPVSSKKKDANKRANTKDNKLKKYVNNYSDLPGGSDNEIFREEIINEVF
jgi:RecA-family ATPase